MIKRKKKRENPIVRRSYPFCTFCFILNMSIVPIYSKDCTTCVLKNGLIDHHFQGTLRYKPEPDSRFPYIYEILTHALVHSPKYIKTIFIHIVDTSIKARKVHTK